LKRKDLKLLLDEHYFPWQRRPILLMGVIPKINGILLHVKMLKYIKLSTQIKLLTISLL
jgi:hypothetical protein